MPGWTLVETHPIHGRTFRRPLDAAEQALFWDGRFNGTGDNLHPVRLRLQSPSRDRRLFTEINIAKAWLSTKRRYPLAGATVQLLQAGKGVLAPPSPHFVVRERGLAVLRPNEIVFGRVARAEEVQQRMIEILEGPRPLSDELLVQLHVFHEGGNSDTADVLHLMTVTAHCVTDEVANRTLMRCLIDTLARSGGPDPMPAQIPLEDRLAMVVPAENLLPVHLRWLSPARRRWRKVIATVIFRLWVAKGQGGHTLPCRRTRSTPFTPARSGFDSVMLTEAQTSTVMSNCRRYGFTFGNAYLALTQVAMTRVLYRRYLRGEISEEEWAYRKRQPYRRLGPLNERPHLDKDWFEKGGGGEFMASVKGIFSQLPFMTLSETEEHRCNGHDLSDGAPPFSGLLAFDRFLHRVGLLRKQTEAFISHPLFSEIMHILVLSCSHHSRLLALRWMKQGGSFNAISTQGNSDDSVVPVVVEDMPTVIAHGGSTFGDVDLMSPTEYPLPPSHPLSPFSSNPHPAKAGYATPPPAVGVDTTPRIAVENALTRLHARPAQLFLCAMTLDRQLRMYVFYDRNVYAEGVVAEWLDELKGAVLWYLGQTHRSRRDHWHDDGVAIQTPKSERAVVSDCSTL